MELAKCPTQDGEVLTLEIKKLYQTIDEVESKAISQLIAWTSIDDFSI